jgi:DNA-binding NtrC family response regulator
VAPTDATVLVQGRSGTGKELVAQALHASSPRRYNPLVAVHCGALAEGVLESELFGHEKGAFTGASYHHKGKFEQADGGTIFLDEIGEVSPKVQVELLRVLEEKRVTRVGGRESVAADFRVVAATNRDLAAMVGEGRFREDLYWRLNVVAITLPALAERPEDVRTLAEHFLARFARQMNIKELRFAPEALAALEGHAWPGNVRELQNAVERAVVLGRPPVIRREDLPLAVAAAPPPRPSGRTLADVERAHVETVLAESAWNITQAAAALGVDRGTLYNKIQKYGLVKPAHAG